MRSQSQTRRPKRYFETLENRHLLAGDLVAHWNADSLNDLENGSSIPSWDDAIGGVTATRRGDPTLAKQHYGGRSAVRFDTTDGDDEFRIRILDNPINRADDFSIIVTFATDSQELVGGTSDWFRASGLVDANGLGFSNGWGTSINSAGQIGAGLENGFGQPITNLYSDVAGLNDGELHTFALIRQAETLSLIVDKQAAVITSDASSAPRSNTEISIGDILGNGPGFTGDIAEVRMYQAALTPAEWSAVQSEINGYYRNQIPLATDDEYTTTEDTFFLSVNAANGVLANDTDADGDELTAAIIDPAQNGQVTLKADGSFLYDPNPDFFGEDSFTYQAVDFRPSDPATVRITVTPTYDQAIPVSDQYRGLSGEILEIPEILGILSNDTNVDNNPLQAILDAEVENGSLALAEDGSFLYDPQGFAGTTSFRYRINDGTSESPPASVTLIINSPPVIRDDAYSVQEDLSLEITAEQGVLTNDNDIDGDAITATLVDAPSHGTLEFQEDGSFSYQPKANFSGTDSFTYRISDLIDTTESVGNVILEVTPVNDAPIARPDLYLTFLDTPLEISASEGVLKNDSDIENQPLSTVLVQAPQHGSLELATNGALTYRPEADFEGTDSFTYRAADASESSLDATVTLIVTTLDKQIVINEIHYDPPDNTVPAEFIELVNQGQQSVDVSNWLLTGGVRYVIPEGTQIAPQSYLVVAQHPDTLRDLFSAPSIGPFEGRLSSEGEVVSLRNSAGEVVDRVDYRQGFPWPTAAGGDGPSMELIHPTLENDLGGSWRASQGEPTPGQPNSILSSEAAPQIRQVRHLPQQPKSGQATVVTAKVTDPDGVSSVELEYQVVTAGNYIPALLPLSIRDLRRTPDKPRELNPDYVAAENWTSLVMVDDGTQGDSQAGDDIYTATLPGQTHRTLMRYRIQVTDTGLTSAIVPYEDDASRNFAYFVYDGVPNYEEHSAETLQSVPVYHLIARNEDVTTMIAYSSRNQIGQGIQARFAYNWPSTFVYDGMVYDNINMRLRGANGRYYLAGKRSMRFRFNDGHYFQAKNQDGEEFPDKWRTLTTGKMFDNRQTQTWSLNENINMYLFNQIGVPAPETYYVHFRVIDSEQEAPDQWSGDFWGLNFIIETYDVRFLDNHDLERGNLYKLINQTRDWEQQQRYQAPNAVNNGADHDNIELNLVGRRTADFIDAHVNLEKYFLYHTFTEAIRHYDYWPDANKNMVYYFEPDYLSANDNLGKLWILPWDTDASWGPTWNSGHDVVYNSIFAGNGGGSDRQTTEEFWPSYYNTLREIRDLLWQPDQIEPLIEQFADVLRPLAAADLARWRGGPASEGRHNGLSGPGTQGIDSLAQDMKNFAFKGGTWPGGSVSRGGRARHLDRLLTSSRSDNDNVPNTPSLTYVGQANFPADGLRFKTSDYVDSQGPDSFVGMEWRIAEITDPSAPTFDPTADMFLEWNATWESGELSEFTSEIKPPTSAVEPGHSYRARVRMKDNQGHWSHWSDPVEFIATPATTSLLVDALRVSEIHYHPAAPSTAEIAAGFDDADDFEFIELTNIGTLPIDLRGAQLVRHEIDGDVQGVDFHFKESNIEHLDPGQRILVVEDTEAFEFRYGQDFPVAGQWSGALSNGGELLTLTGDGFEVQQFAYLDDWHPSTDGDGASLELINPKNADLASWGQATSWKPSQQLGGSPGTVDQRLVGDVNGDGRFDSSDLVAVFQVGEYEDDIEDNSIFEDGDWNGDGDFTTSDLVLAFTQGHYADAVAAILSKLTAEDLETQHSSLVTSAAKKSDTGGHSQFEDLRTRELVFAEFAELKTSL